MTSRQIEKYKITIMESLHTLFSIPSHASTTEYPVVIEEAILKAFLDVKKETTRLIDIQRRVVERIEREEKIK